MTFTRKQTKVKSDFSAKCIPALRKVLGIAQGKSVEPAALQQAFGQRYCQRRIDEHGFVRLGRWKIYVEEGLPKTPVQLSYWDGKLRAEYGEHRLMEYQCR